MKELEFEVLKNIERHLKNISISLRVIEYQGQKNPIIPISLRKLKEHYDFGGIDITGEDGVEMDNMFLTQWSQGEFRLSAPVSGKEQNDTNESVSVIPEGYTVIDKIPDPASSIPVQPRQSLWSRWVDYFCKDREEISGNITWASIIFLCIAGGIMMACMGASVLIGRN